MQRQGWPVAVLGIVWFGGLAAPCVLPAQKVQPVERNDAYDKVVNDFILYDIGKLRGMEGQRALSRFQQLEGTAAVPALVRGANRSAKMSASCPILAIQQKLQHVLRNADAKTLEYVVQNLDRPSGQQYERVLESLRDSAASRLEKQPRRSPTKVASMRAATPSQLRRSRMPVEEWQSDDLAEAAVQEKGDSLVQVLEELEKREGTQYTEALAAAIPSLDDQNKTLARGLLAQRLARMSDDSLRAKLKDSSDEVRAAAARAVGYRGSPLYAELAAAMRDKSPQVAANARDVLGRMLGQDFGPADDAAGIDWYRASKQWEQWIEQHAAEKAAAPAGDSP